MIKYHKRYFRDYEVIFRSLEDYSPRAALRFARNVEKFIGLLENNNQLGGTFETGDEILKMCNIRVFPVPRYKNYLIYYRILNNDVFLLSIYHSSRDSENLLIERLVNDTHGAP